MGVGLRNSPLRATWWEAVILPLGEALAGMDLEFPLPEIEEYAWNGARGGQIQRWMLQLRRASKEAAQWVGMTYPMGLLSSLAPAVGFVATLQYELGITEPPLAIPAPATAPAVEPPQEEEEAPPQEEEEAPPEEPPDGLGLGQIVWGITGVIAVLTAVTAWKTRDPQGV